VRKMKIFFWWDFLKCLTRERIKIDAPVNLFFCPPWRKILKNFLKRLFYVQLRNIIIKIDTSLKKERFLYKKISLQAYQYHKTSLWRRFPIARRPVNIRRRPRIGVHLPAENRVFKEKTFLFKNSLEIPYFLFVLPCLQINIGVFPTLFVCHMTKTVFQKNLEKLKFIFWKIFNNFFLTWFFGVSERFVFFSPKKGLTYLREILLENWTKIEKGVSWLADWDETPVYYGMSSSSTYHLRFQACELKQKGDDKYFGGLWKNIHMIKKKLYKRRGKKLISSPKSEFLKVKILPQNLHFSIVP